MVVVNRPATTTSVKLSSYLTYSGSMVTSCTTKLIKQTFYILPRLIRYFHFRWYFPQKSSEFAAPRSTMEYLMRKDWNMNSYRPTFTNYLSRWYQSAPKCMLCIAQSFLHVASCSKLLFTDKWTIRRSTRDTKEFWLMIICISRSSWKFKPPQVTTWDRKISDHLIGPIFPTKLATP